MNLVTYKKNHQGFYDRQIKHFDRFPSKDECLKMGLVVAHAMDEYKLDLHRTGRYNPLHSIDYSTERN